MVTAPGERQSSRGGALSNGGLSPPAPLVAFDFDGTLTTRDSFTAFLKWRIGALAYALKMIRLIPAALRYLVDRDKGRIKSAAIRVYLGGLPRAEIERDAEAFAEAMAPSLLRPDALRVWRRHRADGAHMVIVSASPDTVVAPFARGLGAELLIASQIAFDPDERVGGGLQGRNCRGPEKVERLKAAFGETVQLAAAYGDTDGDLEMLEIAEQKFMRLFTGDPAKPGRGVN